MKNITYKASALIISFALITPLFASAQTVSASGDVSAQVQSLMSQITTLESQLHDLVSSVVGSTTIPMWNASSTRPALPPASTSTPMMMGGGANCPQINRNLSVGSSGPDVSQLQDVLASEGFLSASSTGFFGQLTARALMQFQDHFGIASSSTGNAGPLTRDFIRNHCDGGQGNGNGQGGGQPQGNGQGGQQQMGSSTSAMPMMPAHMQWNQGSSTGSMPMHPPVVQMGGGQMGSSTMPAPQPCAQGGGTIMASSSGNLSNSAAVIAALFVPHSPIPGMMPPCPDVGGEMQQ